MKKIAFVFPGQGSQYMGMGKEVIENFEISREVFEKAKSVLDFDLEQICFNDNEKVHMTQYTQPALLTVSIAILKVIQEMGIKSDYVAGLSLGEYTALVANGALDFESAVRIVRKRGQFMEEAANNTKGTMAAVMGSDEATILEICNSVNGIVSIANYNSPAQKVISGEIPAVEAAGKLLSEKGAKVIQLKVSGAFHSLLMEEASIKLKKVLDNTEFKSFDIPYTTNVTGELVYNTDDILSLLVKQVKASVKWEDCVRTLISAGVDTFIEIGPGKTLSGLIKKTDRSVKVINVEDVNGINKLKDLLEE